MRKERFYRRIKRAIINIKRDTSKNGKIYFDVGWSSSNHAEYYLRPDVCKGQTKEEMQKYVEADKTSQYQPIRVYDVRDDNIYYLYNGVIYKPDRRDYSVEKIKLLILEFEDKERQKFERLKNKFSSTSKEEKRPKRESMKDAKSKNTDERIVKRFNRTQIIKEIMKRDHEWYNNAKNGALIKNYTAYEKEHDVIIIDGKTDSP